MEDHQSPDMPTLDELRAANEKFNARWKEKGGKLTSYTCRHCDQAIETRQPGKKDVGPKGYWDSLKACPHCGEMDFVAIWPDGRVELFDSLADMKARQFFK